MKPMGTKLIAVVFAGTVLAGCQTDKSSMNDFFPCDEQQAVRNIADVQAASGARADATLQPFHFDGDRLNSLGAAKLDLMLKDDDTAQPLVVYLNMPAPDAMFGARRDSILRYLEDRGATSEQVRIESGQNPAARSQAAGHLSRMERTENSVSNGDPDGQTSTVSEKPMK